MNNKQTLAMLFSSVALLSGCGGGGGYDVPPPPPPAATDAIPDTASASAAGFNTYLVSLSKDLPETKDALDLATFMPKTAEDTEPDPVD
jgi:hypothetical protein